jgi:Tfp pilus assembly PilM family ATPase
MLGARARTATGIHLAEDALYVVQLRRGRRGAALQARVREALPSLFAPSHLASDELRMQLAEFLRHVGRQYGLAYDNPCLALDRRMVLLKRRPIVPGDARASREWMQWEAEQLLTSRPHEYGLDFWWTRRHGFLVAVRRRLLELYLALCDEAGMDAPRFDLEPFAMANAAEAAGVLDAGSSELMVGLWPWGAGTLLLRDRELEAVGWCPWEEGLEADEARSESLAGCVHGLLADADGGQPAPARLWLCGSDAASRAWIAQVESRWSVDGVPLDPFARVDCSTPSADGRGDAPAASFAVAAGLAFRALSGG